MRYSYRERSNSKVVLYSVILAVVLGVGAIVVQDIQAPMEHVSKEIKVNLDK